MESVAVGDPVGDGTIIGPVVSEVQWNKIQALIEAGIEEGATLVTGGPRPLPLDLADQPLEVLSLTPHPRVKC